MYTEALLDPERCTHNKPDEKVRRAWLITCLRQIDQYEDINNPYRDQQEDDTMGEAEVGTEQHKQTEIPFNTSV